MAQNIQNKGLMNWILLLLLGAAEAVVAVFANSATGLASSVFLAVGFLVAAVSYLQMRLEDRERLERMEFDELKKSAASATLFAEQAADTFPARRARAQFERFFVPVFTIFLFVVQCAAVYVLWKYLAEDKPSTPQQGAVAMALNGLFALVFFQFGKYSAVLARLEDERLLRPQASYLLLGALLSLVTALVEVAGWAGYPKIDLLVSRVLTVVMGLAAAENLLTLVFEVYRPRVKGQAEHPLYESRLIGLLSQPGGLITTAAQALDYQFGFKVSETWFYRFLERALAWLVLLQLGLLLLSTCFVFIEPGEQGLREYFGRPRPGHELLGSGPHLKWPWPIERVYRYSTGRIRSFVLGIEPDEAAEKERVQLWSKSHAKEENNMLVASGTAPGTNVVSGDQAVPVNLLAVNVPVQYNIRDLQKFAYNYADAGELLEWLANDEVTRYLISVDINDIMGPGRLKAAEDLRQRVQARADSLQLGVQILFVGLQGIHPPVKVAPDFEKVIGAIQEKEATNLYARAYAATNVLIAAGVAAQRTNEAEAYRARTLALAEGNAARFTNQLAAFHASPDVYVLRTKLDTLGHVMASARTYVLALTNTHGVVTLDLEEKIRKDILDVMLPPASKK